MITETPSIITNPPNITKNTGHKIDLQPNENEPKIKKWNNRTARKANQISGQTRKSNGLQETRLKSNHIKDTTRKSTKQERKKKEK